MQMTIDQPMQFQPAPGSLIYFVQRIERHGTVTIEASTSIDAARAAYAVHCEREPREHIQLCHWSRILEERMP